MCDQSVICKDLSEHLLKHRSANVFACKHCNYSKFDSEDALHAHEVSCKEQKLLHNRRPILTAQEKETARRDLKLELGYSQSSSASSASNAAPDAGDAAGELFGDVDGGGGGAGGEREEGSEEGDDGDAMNDAAPWNGGRAQQSFAQCKWQVYKFSHLEKTLARRHGSSAAKRRKLSDPQLQQQAASATREQQHQQKQSDLQSASELPEAAAAATSAGSDVQQSSIATLSPSMDHQSANQSGEQSEPVELTPSNAGINSSENSDAAMLDTNNTAVN